MLKLDIKKLLALIVVCFFFAITIGLAFVTIPPGNLDIFKVCLIAIISIVQLAIGYYFGSSAGSTRKTELQALANTAPPSIPPLEKTDSRLDEQGGYVRLSLLFMIVSLVLFACLINGCATVSGKADTPQITAGKTLLAIQAEIVSTREAIGVPCQQGYIPAQACRDMDSIYQQSKPAYDIAADAAALALKSGSTADAAVAAEKKVLLQALANNIITLAAKYGVEGGK